MYNKSNMIQRMGLYGFEYQVEQENGTVVFLNREKTQIIFSNWFDVWEFLNETAN